MVEVPWFVQDADGDPYYRTCDICERSATDDVVAGKPVAEFRKFFQFPELAGLVLCEHCLPEPERLVVAASLEP